MVPPWRIPNAISFKAALRAGRAQTLDDVPLTHDDIAFLQYTGGTTGVAKGAILTHGNLVANLQQVRGLDRPRPGGRQGDGHPSAAALPRLRTDLEPRVHEDRRPRHPDHQSAGHARRSSRSSSGTSSP